MIRKHIYLDVLNQVKALMNEKGISADVPKFSVERPKEDGHGDFATNAPFLLVPLLKDSPQKVADKLIEYFSHSSYYKKIERGGSGFVNFFLADVAWVEELREIIALGASYGCIDVGEGKKVQVEFVSANPVGPMHVGHGRWAAVGDSLARILSKAGYRVEKEFYINDAGTQMDIFAESVACRYSELLGEKVEFPKYGYQGGYIREIAQEIIDSENGKYLGLSLEERKEAFKETAYKMVLEHLRKVLARMDVNFDVWFSERELYEKGKIHKSIELLKSRGYVYEDEGATWLRTTDFGDEKNRVLLRANGEPTYFAGDIAYHVDKHDRGFDTVINIWGADHHGYVRRMQSAMEALGYGKDFLEVIIGQLVNLHSGGKPVRMSKRTGEMVTLEELLDEVGKDALRFFFCSKSTDSTLDFDIDLAKEESQRNPVYYAQYAHARICSILKFAEKKGVDVEGLSTEYLSYLSHPEEFKLMRELSRFPEIVEDCAKARVVHHLPTFIIDLARQFHSFYTQCRVVQAERGIAEARLLLSVATKKVIAEALRLLGVNAPPTM